MRVFYIACAASLVAIGVMFALNTMDNSVEARRDALAMDLRALEGAWEAPELNRGTSPERHEQSITGKPEIWRHIVERPKPRPQPFDIGAALRGVEATRQTLGERVLIRTPSNARGEWFQVGDRINGVPIVEITRESVTFSVVHTDGQTYTHSVSR